MNSTNSPVALPQITFRRPLISLNTAQAALDRDREGVWRLIDDGTLRAFNLALEICFKSEVRILAADVEAFQQRRSKPCPDFQTCLKSIFPMLPKPRPGVVAELKLATVARRLNVRSDHIFNLIEAGWLRLVPGAKARPGPTGSPDVEIASVIEFLRKRRIT